MGDLDDGLDKFEKAHELAVSLSDEAAQDAINKAITDLKRKIADGMTFFFTLISYRSFFFFFFMVHCFVFLKVMTILVDLFSCFGSI